MAGTKKVQKHDEMLRKQLALHEERLKRERLKGDVVSCASDAKWRKIFDLLQSQFDRSQPIPVGSARVKLLREHEPFEFPRLLSSCFEDDYFDGFHGAFWYREIEWIEVQTGGIRVEFDCQVDSETFAETLMVYGYRRSQR